MAMKKVYSTKTGKVTWAQPNPARPGEYLMPADATEFPPPAFDDTSKKAKYVNNSWVTEDLTPEEIHEASGSTGTFIGQLDDIGNITLDSVTDGQALVWDEANNKWTNGNVAAGEGGVSSGGGGIIRQVKNYKMMGKVANELVSNGWVDVQTINFTPKSATSKVLISVVYGMAGKGALCLLRDGTEITAKTTDAGKTYMNWQNVSQVNSDNNSERYTLSLTVEDTPNTTDTVTYKTQIHVYDHTGEQGGICVNPIPYNEGNGVYSSVTIWEIDESNDIQNIVDSQTNVDGPSFHAVLGGASNDTRNQTPLLFDDVKTNHTNSYDPATGLFTAPEDGYYQFGAGAHCHAQGGWTTIRLHAGGDIISNAWENDAGGNSGQLFCAGVQYLYTGDTAYVSMDTGKASNYMAETYWYFYGFKIANGDTTVNITSGSSIDGITNVDGTVVIGEADPNSSYPASLLHLENLTSDPKLRIISSDTGRPQILLGDTAHGAKGRIIYDNSTDSLLFYGSDETNGSAERMRFTSDGKLGIFTDSPDAELTLASLNTSEYMAGLSIGTHSKNNESDIALSMNSVINGDNTLSLAANSQLLFYTGTTDRLTGVAGGTERMRINNDGRVGIGITPHHNLHLAGDSSQYGSALKIEENTHGTSARAGIHMGDWVIGQDAPGDGTKDFFFYNAGHRLFIKDDGRIGINNTNPRAALAIKGGYVEDSPNQGHGVDISSRDLHAKIEFSASDGCFLDFGKGNGSDFSGRLWYSHPHKVMDFYVEQKHRFRVHETGVWLPTDHGAINIACEGHGYAHFRTDQSYFFFDRQCQASGGFVTYSDERLKENVAVVENAVESLKKIRGVSFTWKKNADSQTRREGKMFGVLAQEVQQIDPAMCELPEAVTDGDEKFYTFDYSNLTPYFIEAIKEQQATIESQQAKIDSLEARLAALEAKLS